MSSAMDVSEVDGRIRRRSLVGEAVANAIEASKNIAGGLLWRGNQGYLLSLKCSFAKIMFNIGLSLVTLRSVVLYINLIIPNRL